MPEISYKIGLCSQNGPVFTSLMKPMAEKYMFVFLSLSTMFFLATSETAGADGREPSVGIGDENDGIGGQSWADPKT